MKPDVSLCQDSQSAFLWMCYLQILHWFHCWQHISLNWMLSDSSLFICDQSSGSAHEIMWSAFPILLRAEHISLSIITAWLLFIKKPSMIWMCETAHLYGVVFRDRLKRTHEVILYGAVITDLHKHTNSSSNSWTQKGKDKSQKSH